MAKKSKKKTEVLVEVESEELESTLMNEEDLENSGLRELVDKGKEQGFLTYEEINSMLPEDISDPDQVEETIQMLIDIGIEEDSFEPVGIFLTYPFVLAASGDAPYKNLKELAAHAKNNDVVLGHFGAGLVPTKASFAAAKKLGFEFADESAFDMLDCNSLSAGDADVINTTLALIEPCLGEINVLANIGEERIGKLPNVGTVAEQAGINNIELWNGLFVKKGTPQNVKDKIAQIAKKAMLGDAAQGLMEETGARVYWQDANESSARIATDRKKLAELNAMLK